MKIVTSFFGFYRLPSLTILSENDEEVKLSRVDKRETGIIRGKPRG
jgi:hypothetical protein